MTVEVIAATISAAKESFGIIMLFGGFLWVFFKVSSTANRALEMGKENREFTLAAIKDLSFAMQQVGQRLGSVESGIGEIKGEMRAERRRRSED